MANFGELLKLYIKFIKFIKLLYYNYAKYMTKTEFLIRYVNLDHFRNVKCYEFTSIS